MRMSGRDGDGRRARLPLRDSTGNIQHHGLGSTTLCLQDFPGLTTVPASVPATGLLAAQSLDLVSLSQHPAPMNDYRRTRRTLREFQQSLDSPSLYPLPEAVPPPIPTPPIVPTQSLDAHYATAGSLRLRRQNLEMQRRRRRGVNPFYNHPLFLSYRKKQADKDLKVWPDVLEDAFLDGEPPFLSFIPRKPQSPISVG